MLVWWQRGQQAEVSAGRLDRRDGLSDQGGVARGVKRGPAGLSFAALDLGQPPPWESCRDNLEVLSGGGRPGAPPAFPLADCSSCACGWSLMPRLAPRKPRVCPVVAAVSYSVGAVTWDTPHRACHLQTRPQTF